jgi:cytochrome c oxidase cbb3-type subunit 3/ubiquinol-cytochrome c reductase cytochrome c subunit
MKAHSHILQLLCCALILMSAGCKNPPGKPQLSLEVSRPEQVTDFKELYSQNCAACHGDHGQNGAAISLANPVYLAIAEVTNIQRITAAGIPGTMMPPFSKQAGGMLTDRQISILARGMIDAWGNHTGIDDKTLPRYASSSAGDAASGQKAFATFCASCHGADGKGVISAQLRTGSLVDPAYLSLVSDQGLRSTIIAGWPEQGMPNWRSDIDGPNARAMTDQEITDVVAWLAAQRVATPGQPYQPHMIENTEPGGQHE